MKFEIHYEDYIATRIEQFFTLKIGKQEILFTKTNCSHQKYLGNIENEGMANCIARLYLDTISRLVQNAESKNFNYLV